MSKLIDIDLGTTNSSNSCVAVIEGGSSVIIPAMETSAGTDSPDGSGGEPEYYDSDLNNKDEK